ncbi:hypothetical protein [Kyrpidia sp.]|uniref:hypothetical protein n=1 Tax=Kyrpidia sp. TaxID=2073077 RepID=UPI002587A1E4|nr:hypothetical protein [Kyrpidia sp.]MCL6574518.1 hypothetical protein [Kyrpidia sp.]
MRRVERNENPLAHLVEKSAEWTFRMAVFGLFALTAVQALLLLPQARAVLVPVERLEGVPVQGMPPVQQAQISLSLEGANAWPGAYVTVDGKPVEAFGQAQVWLAVREGDTVQVDATKAQGSRRILIDHESPSLLTPVAGLEWDVDGGKKSPAVQVHFIAINP